MFLSNITLLWTGIKIAHWLTEHWQNDEHNYSSMKINSVKSTIGSTFRINSWRNLTVHVKQTKKLKTKLLFQNQHNQECSCLHASQIDTAKPNRYGKAKSIWQSSSQVLQFDCTEVYFPESINLVFHCGTAKN